MKKWQIVSIVSVAAAMVVAVSGFLIYKYMVLPKYIEPVIEEVSDYLQDDEILETLHNEAEVLYENGMLDDNTYTNFLRVYDEHYRDDEAYAESVLAARDSRATTEVSQSVETNYASNKVGVEVIRENNTDENGAADIKYSDTRTSDRVKAEDYIEAEKIIEESKNTPEPTDEPLTVETAYAKLKSKMTAGEFATFTKIMSKLSIGTLSSYVSDKEGLKSYLHSCLSDDEYRTIVNLGYKYVYVFLEK